MTFIESAERSLPDREHKPEHQKRAADAPARRGRVEEPAEADERGGGSEDQIRLLIEGHGRVRLGLRHALFFISAMSIRTRDVYQNNALEGGHGLNR